jgi:hypothetical protein
MVQGPLTIDPAGKLRGGKSGSCPEPPAGQTGRFAVGSGDFQQKVDLAVDFR